MMGSNGREGEDDGVKEGEKEEVVVKVGMVGDAQIGKTSLMVKFAEAAFEEDYINTLGVNFMEKTVSIRNAHITFSIWDLGGQREFINMLPLVCNDAACVLFMFDLSRIETLHSIKEWYRQARGFNKSAVPILLGTKYDVFASFPAEEQAEVKASYFYWPAALEQRLAFVFVCRACKAHLACFFLRSASHAINIHKAFKVALARVFELECNVAQITGMGDPILEWTVSGAEGHVS